MTKTRSKALLERFRRASPGHGPGSAAALADAIEGHEHTQQCTATLIVNPYSSGMTARREREIVTLLRTCTELEVRRTERPGHAPELARRAADAGSELIVACGGDGTANEVLNGLDLAEGTAERRPLFTIIPAGGTNVLCRSLGLPNDPVKAARQVTAAIAERRSHAINLGKLDERVFMFSAGVGFDGELVRRIEARRSGRRPGDLAHLATVGAMFMHERFRYDDVCEVEIADTGERLRGSFVMCGNTTPVSYLGKLPVHLMPDCTLESGLDFILPRRATPALFARASLPALGKRGHKRTREKLPDRLQHRHDVHSFKVTCDEPVACQADGEFLGERTHISFELLEDAIRLVH